MNWTRGKVSGFRKPDSYRCCERKNKELYIMFLVLLWLFMSYRVHSSPLICKYLCLYCSFVGSGYRERDIYCIYEVKKKNSNVKEKKNVCYKKNSCLLECANFFQTSPFWKSINYCCTLLLWWQNNRNSEAQSVFCWLRQTEGRREKPKTSGSSLSEGRLCPPRWDPCTCVVH